MAQASRVAVRSVCAAALLACACGGRSRAGTDDTSAGPGASGSGGAMGSAGAGGRQSGDTGNPSTDGAPSQAGSTDAGTAIIVVSHPGTTVGKWCERAGMQCGLGLTQCTCTSDHAWECRTLPLDFSFYLPEYSPIPNAHCDWDRMACDSFVSCIDQCECIDEKWQCTEVPDCVVPECSSAQDGDACAAIGQACGGGCGSCVCELGADGALRFTCTRIPC